MDVPDTGEVEKVLGKKPASDTEPPERFPGGVDSIADEEKYGEIPPGPLAPDGPSRDNPATSEAPAEVTEGEDKQQEPDDDPEEEHEEAGESRDTDAGSTARQGDKDADLDGGIPDDGVDTADEPGA